MNKLFSTLTLAVALLALCCFSASAQDEFAKPRVIVLDQGTVRAATSAVTTSNLWVDIHGYSGVAMVLCSATAEAGGDASGVCYARLEGSATGTNGWTLLSNCAVMTLSTNTIADLSRSGPGSTNVFLFPGTYAAVTSGTAGYAGTPLTPAAFTSTGVLCSNVSGTVSGLGFKIADQPRFIHVVYTVTAQTNVTSAFLIGVKSSGTPY